MPRLVVALPTLAFVLATACSAYDKHGPFLTPVLWAVTNPNKGARIAHTPVKVEQKAEAVPLGVERRARPAPEVSYEPKSGLRKAADYSARIFGTPLTLSVDLLGTAIVLAVLLAPVLALVPM